MSGEERERGREGGREREREREREIERETHTHTHTHTHHIHTTHTVLQACSSHKHGPQTNPVAGAEHGSTKFLPPSLPSTTN